MKDGNRIIRLTIKNIKKISTAIIEPKGNSIVISGRNGAGKTTVLDSIEYALTNIYGTEMNVVSEGQNNGYIIVETEQFIARRVFTSHSKSYISIQGKDGYTINSPYDFLNELSSNFNFDPIEFIYLPPKLRVKRIKKALGLDFSVEEERLYELFDKRKDIMISYKQAQKSFDQVKNLDIGSDEFIRHDEVVEEINRATEWNNSLTELDSNIREIRATLQSIDSDIESYMYKIRVLNDERKKIENDLNELLTRKNGKEKIDISLLTKKLMDIEDNNVRYRNKLRYDEVKSYYDEISQKYESITKEIEDIQNYIIDETRKKSAALDHITFKNETLYVNGYEFDQLSQAEKILFTVKLAILNNPKLKVILVREGPALDHETLQLLKDCAEKLDVQIWIERVEDNQNADIIIEDGVLQGEIVNAND